MRRRLIVLILAAALFSACSSSSDDNGEEVFETTTPDGPTTTAGTAPKGTTASGTCPDQPSPGSSGPPPSQGAALADGHYFGYITELDAEDLSLRFDVAQLFTGDAAAKAASEDGGESPPPNDYWIRNNTSTTRTLKLAEATTFCIADPQDIVKNHKVSLSQLNQRLGDGEPLAVWLDLQDGTIERVQQQYFP